MTERNNLRLTPALWAIVVIAIAYPGVASAQLRQLQPVSGRGAYAQPLRVAECRWTCTGQVELTTGWMSVLEDGPSPRAPLVPYFDCAEFDVSGFIPTPIGFCAGGCSNNPNCAANPPADPSTRYSFGTNYVAPMNVNDMTVGTGFEGAHATRMLTNVAWTPPTPTNLWLLVFTSETFHDCATGLPATEGEYGGIIADFGPLPNDFYYLNIEALTGSNIYFQMPQDGSGAYRIALGTAYDEQTMVLTLATFPGTQVLVWGTGEDENPPDGRPGTQGHKQWDDFSPPDGAFTANECWDYTYFFCPSPLGAMIVFYGPSTSVVPGDCDGNGALNIDDIPCFVNAVLGTDTDPPGGIARSDINADLATDGLDVQGFVDALVTP